MELVQLVLRWTALLFLVAGLVTSSLGQSRLSSEVLNERITSAVVELNARTTEFQAFMNETRREALAQHTRLTRLETLAEANSKLLWFIALGVGSWTLKEIAGSLISGRSKVRVR